MRPPLLPEEPRAEQGWAAERALGAEAIPASGFAFPHAPAASRVAAMSPLRPTLIIACAALAFTSLGAAGCKKGDSSDAGPASNLPVKGPWDAVKITSSNKKATDGSPLFVAENTGAKTVKVVFMDFYGYDAKGNQVAKKELSYNRTLKAGQKDQDVYTGDVKDVVTWEATYHGIEFEGEDKPTMDYKRAPDKKPKGK